MKKFVQFLAGFLSLLAALLGLLLHIKNRLPRGMLLLFPKLMAGALSPFTGLLGALGGLLGLLSGAPLTALLGVWGAYTSWKYLQKTVTPSGALEKAFGRPAPERSEMLQYRWDWTFPPEPEPRWLRDVAFWTLDGERELLCDLWQPAASVTPSGMAILFFHGSDWYLMDKDTGTRPTFRHLAAQGHVVMDVAYRLSPEAHMSEMVGDVKRAVAWMKAHGAAYGVDPAKIVLMGASAGGQLALLAAFAPQHPELTPAELHEADLTVCAVVSAYGPSDLTACYYHTNQDLTTHGLPVTPDPTPPDPRKREQMVRLIGPAYDRLGLEKDSLTGSFLRLLGGHPDEIPDTYALFSPVSHIHPGCPPVFLAQGEDDLITPLAATQEMVLQLQKTGLPVVSLVFAQTDHGFDLAMPEFNPAVRVLYYELERFLALVNEPS